MSRNDGKEEEKTGKFLQVFFSGSFSNDGDAGASSWREEKRGRRQLRHGAVSFLGQGIQQLIVAPVNLRQDFLAG